MKRYNIILILASVITAGLFTGQKTDLTALEIISKANDLRYGETSIGSMDMTLVRPSWKRSISMKMWT